MMVVEGRRLVWREVEIQTTAPHHSQPGRHASEISGFSNRRSFRCPASSPNKSTVSHLSSHSSCEQSCPTAPARAPQNIDIAATPPPDPARVPPHSLPGDTTTPLGDTTITDPQLRVGMMTAYPLLGGTMTSIHHRPDHETDTRRTSRLDARGMRKNFHPAHERDTRTSVPRLVALGSPALTRGVKDMTSGL